MSLDATKLVEASTRFAKPVAFRPAYGTAGFRSKADVLASTVFRCGVLTAVRSMILGKGCGLMITASHNPEPDNGVKIVEPDGGMLITDWEALATELANAPDDEVAKVVERVLDSHDYAPRGDKTKAVVVLGCDTRPSAPGLVTAAKEGIIAAGGVVIDLGTVTTPQLHFAVVHLNNKSNGMPDVSDTDRMVSDSMQAYLNTIVGGYLELTATAQGSETDGETMLHVDCANGVGALQFQPAVNKLAASSCGLTLHLINVGGDPGEHCGLNNKCGADFVQKDVVAPNGFSSLPDTARCCSVDGDADRLVYFQLQPVPQEQGAPRRVSLLDGDKIAALAAKLVKTLLAKLPDSVCNQIKVGVVQTAYANGASTYYLEQQLGLPVVCTKTGVKHLHPAAHAFDVGIYFEANGHGTVLFSHSLINKLEQMSDKEPAAAQLLALSKCVNQTVGDALSCILLVEAALKLLGCSVQDWQLLYSDLPSKQRKLVVKDRYVVVSNDVAERRVSSPEGLQDAVDKLVAAAGPQARSFVRASGTEDAVRVYAEASTKEAADQLALQVAQAVYDFAGGVGDRPVV